MRSTDIKNKYTIDLIFQNGNPDWSNFIESFKKKLENIKETKEIHKVIAANKHLLDALKEHNASANKEILLMAFDKGYKKIVKEDYSMPKNDSDINYILDLIRSGILVEDASNKLKNVLKNEELQNSIEKQKEYMPKSDFADTLANFIVNLAPKNDGIKKMQDAILHDTDLASMVVPPQSIKENADDQQLLETASSSLHEDLNTLQSLGKLSIKEAMKKLFVRSNQIGTHPDNLKNHYVKKFESKSLAWYNKLIETTIALQKEIDKLKTSGHLDETNEKLLIIKYANTANLDSDELESNLQEMATKKKWSEKAKKEVKEKAHKVTLDRLYNAGKVVLKAEEAKTFGRRPSDQGYKVVAPRKPESDHDHTCFNCDGSGSIPGKWDSRCPICHGRGKVGESVDWKPDDKWLVEAEQQFINDINNGEDWYEAASKYAYQFSTGYDFSYDAYKWVEENLIYCAWQNNLIEEDTAKHFGWFTHINQQLKEKGKDVVESLVDEYANLQEDHKRGRNFALSVIKKCLEDVVQFTGNPTPKMKRDRAATVMALPTAKEPPVKAKQEPVKSTTTEEIPNRLSAKLEDYALQIQVLIDDEATEGKIRTWKDASNLLIRIRSLINKQFDGYNLEQVRDYIWHVFHENTGEGLYHYIQKKAMESGHFSDDKVKENIEEAIPVPHADQTVDELDNEKPENKPKEVIPGFNLNLSDFTGDLKTLVNRLNHTLDRLGSKYDNLSLIMDGDTLQLVGNKVNPKQEPKKEPVILQYPRRKQATEDVINFPGTEELKMKRLATWASDLINTTFMPDKPEAEEVKNLIAKKVTAADIDLKVFDNYFKDMFDTSINNAIVLKRLEDTNASAETHRFENQVNEAISNMTANKCRSGLWRYLRKLTDSSNIAMLSNFESYEGKDKISLKMNVYEASPKRLVKIVDKLKEQLKKEGWMHGPAEDKFIKGDPKAGAMITLHPIKKTFRTGPYKNRELPTLGIEIIGSKKVPL